MSEKRLLVRAMTIDDLPRVLAIEANSFKIPWKEENYHYEINENPLATTMVLTYGDIVIGYVDFWITFDSAQINKIAIDPALRGHQLGKILLEDTINRIAGVDEVNAITLEVRTSNQVAINFYTSFGFEIVLTKKRYYDDGEDAYYMIKVIKEHE